MTIQRDLAQFAVRSSEPNPYEKHFLLKNPFPGRGETRADVCTDQEEIKEIYINDVRTFGSKTNRIRINGTNGAGKTNILRYFELLTDQARAGGYIEKLYPVYVFAPGDSYFDVHEQVVDKLSASFLGELLEKFQSEPDLFKTRKPTNDLLKGIEAIANTNTMPLIPLQEQRQDAFIRWLKGRKLTVADKRELAISGWSPTDIASSSLAIRYLEILLNLLRDLNLCDGIILLFDEFEEIFEGLSRSRQTRYAQDLRHLMDSLEELVYFVVATTPEPSDLSKYPAVERRLDDRLVELKAIDDLDLAISYVQDYLNSERDKYEAALNEGVVQSEQDRPEQGDLSPLSREMIEEEYNALTEEFKRQNRSVLPIDFLPRIRDLIGKRIRDVR